MKFLRALLGFALVVIVFPDSGRATLRTAQVADVSRSLVLLERDGRSYVRDEGSTVELPLAPGARVSALYALDEGWGVAGVAVVEGKPRLELIGSRSGKLLRLPAPAARGRFIHQPVALVEDRHLVGLAWLQGEGPGTFEVRAAAWNGLSWSESTLVSGADLESQLALSGAVLPDGSWWLAWAAVDGDDDEIFVARRGVDGSWWHRRRLHPPNDVPDIQPSVLATTTGALVAWNVLDGADYRVVVARPGDGKSLFLGPSGSVLPRLLAFGDRSLLRFKSVLTDRWVVVELDPSGAPSRVAVTDSPGYEAPVVSADESAVTFAWPAVELENGVARAVPWQPWRGQVPEAIAPPSGALPEPFETEAAGVVYRAFGDSITRATGWPVFPTIVFDVGDDGEGVPPGQACAQSGNPFNIRCGYNLRLEDSLDASFVSDVANDGVGGEGTAAGLSRIDNVLAGGSIVMIMEGSNDITGCGVSTISIRNNISQMVNKATAAGTDSIIASVAKRRRVDGAGGVLPDPCGEDPLTTDLRNKLSALSGSKNRAFADVYNTLDPALGQADYWDATGNGDGVGHPDSSGYGKIEPAFRTPILADSALGAPTQDEPTGNVDDAPTFTWDTTGNARLYRISLTGPSGGDTWFDAGAVCSGSDCSASLDSLESGSYTWNVAGGNLRGIGTASGDLEFEVFAEPPVAGPSTGDPIGDCNDCYGSPTVNLTFEFSDVSDAADYELELSDMGGVISVEAFSADAICAGGNCDAPSTTDLAAGDYEWRVRPINPAGNGPFTPKTAFSVYDSVPGLATLITPWGETFDDTPVYRWAHVAGTTDYRVVVTIGGFNLLYDATTVCDGGLCEIEPANVLSVGARAWRVRGQNPLGKGSYTADVSFEVLDCSLFPTDLVVDSGDTGSADYRACPGTVTATSGFTVSSGETVTLHGDTGVAIEEISVDSGATVEFKSD